MGATSECRENPPLEGSRRPANPQSTVRVAADRAGSTRHPIEIYYAMLGCCKAVIWTYAIQVATAFLGFTIVAVSAIHVCRSGGDAKISDHQVGARNQQIPALPC